MSAFGWGTLAGSSLVIGALMCMLCMVIVGRGSEGERRRSQEMV